MNKKYRLLLKLSLIQTLIIPVFIFFKLIRPPVLDSSSPEFFKMTLLSLPNFFEAIIGTLTLTGVALIVNDRLNKKYQVSTKFIYRLAVVLAGFYVISQEMHIIKIRTNTTMDPNDVIFSVIGLIVGYCIVLYVKPALPDHRSDNTSPET